MKAVFTHRSAFVLCIVWTLVIAWLSLTPSPPQVQQSFLGWDKFQHAVAYGLLTILALRAATGTACLKRLQPFHIAVAVTLFGGLMEVAQGLLTSMRSADSLDLLADAVGVLTAYLFFRFRGSRSEQCHCLIGPAAIAYILLSPLSVSAADEHLLNSTAEYGRIAGRLADEALEVATTPVDTRGYGMLGTLLATGAVAFTSNYDTDIRDKIGGIKGTTLDHVTDAGSIAGDPFLHLGLAAVVYGGGILAESPKYRELGEMLGEAAILADATTFILKSATGRARPNTGNGSGSFRPFRFAADYDALPSMHTASSFAMASVVASAADSPLIGIGAYAAAAFVGFSRIYQDKHWASDVVLGAAIGELCGRVAMGYHASGKARRFSVAPVVSTEAALVAVTGRF